MTREQDLSYPGLDHFSQPRGIPHTVAEVATTIEQGMGESVLRDLKEIIRLVGLNRTSIWKRSSSEKRVAAVFELLWNKDLLATYRALSVLRGLDAKNQSEIVRSLAIATRYSESHSGHDDALDLEAFMVVREYFTQITDQQFVEFFLKSSRGLRVMAKTSGKYRDDKALLAIKTACVADKDWIALAGFLAQQAESDGIARGNEINADQVATELLNQPGFDGWSAVITNLGRLWPQLSASIKMQLVPQMLKIAENAHRFDQRHNYFLDILEASDVLRIDKVEQVNQLSRHNDKIVYLLEFLKGGVNAQELQARLWEFAPTGMVYGRRRELVNYYLDNAMYLGLQHLYSLMPEYDWIEEVVPSLIEAVKFHVDQDNLHTARKALRCLLAIYPRVNLIEIGLNDAQQQVDTPINASAFSARSDYGLMNVPNAIIKFNILELLLAKAHQQTDLKPTLTTEDQSTVVKKELTNGSLRTIMQLQEEAKNLLITTFCWMRQYLVRTVQRELSYQRYRKKSPGLLPYKRDLATNGSAEDIRIFFLRAANNFRSGWETKQEGHSISGHQQEYSLIGGEQWAPICDLGYQMWLVDEKDPAYFGKNSISGLINIFIQIRHNSGGLLEDEPRALFAKDLQSDLLNVISQSTDLNQLISWAVSHGYLTLDDEKRFQRYMGILQS